MESLAISTLCISTQSHSTGVSVFDNHTGRAIVLRIKGLDTFPSSISIGNIIVRKLFAL